jgi:hypothetical protein
VQINALTVNGDNELLKGSNIRHLLLNADSDANVETGITNISRAISAKI